MDIEKRISELLAKMNLDQKVGQIVQPERQFVTPQEVKDYHIGSVLSGGGSTPGDNKPQDWIDMNDAYWEASMEEDDSHLAIPILYGVDAIHGNTNVIGSVVFPHNIGLGAANDTKLMENIGKVTAKEIAATGVEWTFAPTLAVARNSHWGRTYESYSEDPKIVSKLTPNMVKGLQGDYGQEHVIACLKHWVGDGSTIHGIDQGDSIVSEKELRDLHIPPYIEGIKAKALTVMVSLSSWNKTKLHSHKYLITEVLKNELKFDGFVISDWDGINYLSDDYGTAAAMSLNAGLDMFMITDKWKDFIKHIKYYVENGNISMDRLDDAVRRILRVKLEFGLFSKPRPTERKMSLDHSSFGSKEHRKVAQEAVRKSLVLLKNDKEILPLKKTANILVAGKNAHNRGHQCGGFTIEWQGVKENKSIVGGTSIWEGIKKVAPNAQLSTKLDGSEADSAKHDVAIVVIGELPYAEMLGDIRVEGLSVGKQLKGNRISDIESQGYLKDYTMVESAGEGPCGTHLYNHQLHPEDLETIKNIQSNGIPIVTIMVCGRPLVTTDEIENSNAFVVAWLPGSEGQGVSDVLFGDYGFQGKLSFSWPKYDDQNPNIGDKDYDPLFKYGFGLKYKESLDHL